MQEKLSLMNDTSLQDYVMGISSQEFDRPFLHLARWNSRLKTTGGRYHEITHNLDFNPRILEICGEPAFAGVVKHELCHYHLHLLGRGYHHRDADFKSLLKEVDGSRYAPNLPYHGKLYFYTCSSCGQTYTRKRQVNTDKYVCGLCQHHLNLEHTINIP